MLTIEQAELAQYMSQLSECYFQANWHMGLEYALWGGILADRRCDLHQRDFHRGLRLARQHARGHDVLREDRDRG